LSTGAGGRPGQGHEQLLVRGIEPAGRTVGDVQRAGRPVAGPDRHAEEAVYDRVVAGKRGERGMPADLVEPDRRVVPDSQSHDAVPPGQLCDPLYRAEIHAGVDELAGPAVRVAQPRRGVAGAHEGTRRPHDPLQHRVQVDLGSQRGERANQVAALFRRR
jgi:hypothetical protein